MALGNPKANHIDVKIDVAKNVPTKQSEKGVKSKLDPNLQSLVSLIFDMKLIEQSVV